LLVDAATINGGSDCSSAAHPCTRDGRQEHRRFSGARRAVHGQNVAASRRRQMSKDFALKRHTPWAFTRTPRTIRLERFSTDPIHQMPELNT